MKDNKAVNDLSEEICNVINNYVGSASVSEIIGVLEITKHVYIMEALEQEDTDEDDTE